MLLGPNGINMLKAYEGIEDGDPRTVNLDAYLDNRSNDPELCIWTIGYGHVVKDADGRTIMGASFEREAREAYPNGITMEEAEEILKNDAWTRVVEVERLLAGAPTTQNQFDAMVSLLFNIGAKNFSKSSVLEFHKQGLYQQAADAFRLFNKSGGMINQGLVNRRESERSVYLKEDDS